MNSIWIIVDTVDGYSGWDLMGAFPTKEAAEAKLKEWNENYSEEHGLRLGEGPQNVFFRFADDSWHIEEVKFYPDCE